MSVETVSSDPVTTDVVVVGAGPAGAMAAYATARTGVRVLLVDRSAYPRPKVCGCCVNARALELLTRHGLRERVEALRPHRYSTFRVANGGVHASLTLPGGASVSRDKFDLALVEAAVAAGAEFRDRTTASIVPPAEESAAAASRRAVEMSGRVPRAHAPLRRVQLTSEGHPPAVVSCRVLIVADGLGGTVARSLAGGEHVTPSSRIGVSTVVDDAPLDWCHDHCINMAVGRDGYVGMVRLEDGRWNIAAALQPQAVKDARAVGAVIDRVLNDAGLPLSPLFAGAAWRGTVPLSRRPFRVAAERTFFIGDAAGYVEPFTGDGMAAALESGALVASFVSRALQGWQPEMEAEWTSALARHRQRQRRVTTLAAWAVRRPALARGVLHAVARVPFLATPVIEWMHKGILIDEGAVT